MTLNNKLLPVLSEFLWKQKKHSQWSDSGHDEDKSTPTPSVQQQFPLLFCCFFFFLKKSSSCRVKRSGNPPVSSRWHRDVTLLRTSLASGKFIKKVWHSLCVGFTVHCFCEGGAGGANTSQQCNQSQRTCSARRRSALGVPWAGSRSEPLR